MRKYLHLSWVYIKLNLQKNIIYRANAIFALVTGFTYTFFFILSVKFIFDEVGVIKGFDFWDLTKLTILSQLWWYANVIVARKGFQYVSKAINNGSWDMVLLKPINFKYLIPFIQFDFRHLMPFFGALGIFLPMVDYSALSIVDIFLSVAMFTNGVLAIYFLTAVFSSLNFWVGRNVAIFDITIEMPDIAKIPIEFFTPVLKTVFFVAPPIVILINPTFQILFGSVDWWLVASSISVTILMWILAEIFWRIGLKNYSSAN